MAHRLNTNKQFMIGNGILGFAVICVVVIFSYMSMRLSQQKEQERRFLETYTITLEQGFAGRSVSVYLNDSLLLDSLLQHEPLTLTVGRFAEQNALMIVDNPTEKIALFELSEQGGHYRFEREGGYSRLCALVGRKMGEKWPGEAVFDLQSCYYRFTQAYKARAREQMPMAPGDAFLVYLEVFRYDESYDKTPNEFSRDLERIWKEFLVAGAQKPAALLNQPGEKQQNILKTVLRIQPQTVRCVFLYSRSPEVSSWTYWHELGRKALEEAFGTHVETVARENVTAAEADAVIGELAEQGYSVIFATTPVLLNSCMRMSVTHPELKILNCSLLASYHNVRSYYLRIYEAKYILGAIAGALADDDQIGYIADYPIYGTPASINAFALGAQMTNPRARVILDWSTLPGHNPEAALAEQHVHVISGRDISAPKLESRAFGVYNNINGDIQNLAMPVWNWEKLYHGIVRSILTGAWEDEDEHNPDRALSYYMGMSTDAIDIICSKSVPVRLHRLVDLLHERIRSGAFLPFVGPIHDQQGNLRVNKDVALTPQEIISMDYLAKNVEGRIPKFHELVESAQALVELQGIRAVKPESDEAGEGI